MTSKIVVKIEKEIPPPSLSQKDRYTMPRKWPWTSMKPNDSFVVQTLGEARSAHNSFMKHRQTKYSSLKPNWVVKWRKQPDGTYRLWLLEKEI